MIRECPLCHPVSLTPCPPTLNCMRRLVIPLRICLVSVSTSSSWLGWIAVNSLSWSFHYLENASSWAMLEEQLHLFFFFENHVFDSFSSSYVLRKTWCRTWSKPNYGSTGAQRGPRISLVSQGRHLLVNISMCIMNLSALGFSGFCFFFITL